MKAGDKVRLTEEGHEYFRDCEDLGDVFAVGVSGEIVRTSGDDWALIRFAVDEKHVKNPGGDDGWWLTGDQFTIEPVPVDA